jgi:hypothetical protein
MVPLTRLHHQREVGVDPAHQEVRDTVAEAAVAGGSEVDRHAAPGVCDEKVALERDVCCAHDPRRLGQRGDHGLRV